MGGEWRSIDMVHVSLLCDLCRVPPAVRGTNISNLSKIVKNLVERIEMEDIFYIITNIQIWLWRYFSDFILFYFQDFVDKDAIKLYIHNKLFFDVFMYM